MAAQEEEAVFIRDSEEKEEAVFVRDSIRRTKKLSLLVKIEKDPLNTQHRAPYVNLYKTYVNLVLER